MILAYALNTSMKRAHKWTIESDGCEALMLSFAPLIGAVKKSQARQERKPKVGKEKMSHFGSMTRSDGVFTSFALFCCHYKN